MNEQAVTENADVEAEPSVDAGSEQELDALLNEYQGAEQTQPEQPEQEDDSTAVLNELKAERERIVRDRTVKDISSAAERLTGFLGLDHLPEETANSIARGLLYDRAESDPRFLNAFQGRDRDAGAWNNVVEALGKNIQASAKVDRKATADRDGMRAAVRGVSTGESPSEEVSNAKLEEMSNGEFFNFEKKWLAQAKRK